MSLDTFVAGRYQGSYNSVDVGITSQGFEVQHDFEMDDIGESDAYGLTVIDQIFRGGQCHLQFESLASKAGSLTPFWPWGTGVAGSGLYGTLYDSGATNPAVIAVLASQVAKTMALSVVAGTPAASGVPAPNSLTGTNNALMAKNNNSRLLFNSKLRTVPIRLRLFPVVSGTKLQFFATA